MRTYRTLDGYETPYKGEHTPTIKRFFWWLYKKFVDEVYIPKEVSVVVSGYPEVARKPSGSIASIKIVKKRPHYYKLLKEHYIFNDFGNSITLKPPFVYENKKENI